ncbi:MAG TPA: DUF58 domain-containing protein [Ktedonobacteraceae bacterium]|nr:DUF58 domain-containing protein [Ktedonobacteraceae bacterium]
MVNESSTARFPLDADTLQRLDNLALITRKSKATGRPGRRRSPLAGSSMEFADFRRYAPGDDFRRIDWRAYARLERLFLRIFEAEENLTVTLLIDCSDSMQYGRPTKASLATALAAALAYIALKCEDSVITGALTDRLAAQRRVGSGKHAIWAAGEFLSRLPQSGATDLNRALFDLGRVVTSPGLTIVISDFLAPAGYQTGLRAVSQLRQEVALVQILAPDEIEPDLQGDWQLRDSEGSGSVDISSTPGVLQAYRQRLLAFMQELASFAHAHAMTYVMIPSDTALTDVVQRLLRQVEIVK